MTPKRIANQGKRWKKRKFVCKFVCVCPVSRNENAKMTFYQSAKIVGLIPCCCPVIVGVTPDLGGEGKGISALSF